MAREANTELITHIPARELHRGDTIRSNRDTELHIDELHRTHGKVRITCVEVTDTGPVWHTWALAPDRVTPVLTEQPCGCNGTGIYRGGGVVENGTYKGYEGVCYSCAGKGWMDRTDTIRNRTYWAKYARISA